MTGSELHSPQPNILAAWWSGSVAEAMPAQAAQARVGITGREAVSPAHVQDLGVAFGPEVCGSLRSERIVLAVRDCNSPVALTTCRSLAHDLMRH